MTVIEQVTQKKRLKARDKLLSKSKKKHKREQEIQVWDISDYYLILDL